MSPKEKKSVTLVNIKIPHDHDVLSGRGGGTNHHPGNVIYRQLVEERKIEYFNSERLEKPRLAAEVVQIIRQQNPPGRFLKQDADTKLWNEVGDKEAQKKTSQALREGAAEIRHQQEREELVDDEGEGDFDADQHESDHEERQEASLHTQRVSTGASDDTAIPVMSPYVTRGSAHTDMADPSQDDAARRVVDSGQQSFPPALRSVKRATSHENECTDTKRDLKNGDSIKRVALNRDNSHTSKALKEAFLQAYTNQNSGDYEERSNLPPLYPSSRRSASIRVESADVNSEQLETRTDTSGLDRDKGDAASACSDEKAAFDSDRVMRRLSDTMEQTTLGGFIAPARQFSDEGRMRDIDVLYAELASETSLGTSLSRRDI